MSELNFANYDAVAFDYDGTLADTIATHTQARKQAFERRAEETGDNRFTRIPHDKQAEAHQHGSNPTAIIGWLLVEVNIAHDMADPVIAKTVDSKNDIYAELSASGMPAIDGSVALVEAVYTLKPERTFVTTSAHLREVAPFISRYGLETQLPTERLITLEDVHRDHLKPDPRAYQITIERAGLVATPERLLAIEDTPGGVASAKRAGATVIAVCTTHTRESFITAGENVRPDYIFPDFIEPLRLATKRATISE